MKHSNVNYCNNTVDMNRHNNVDNTALNFDKLGMTIVVPSFIQSEPQTK